MSRCQDSSFSVSKPAAFSAPSKSRVRTSPLWFWMVTSKGAWLSVACSRVELSPMELAVMPMASSSKMQITVWAR